MILAQSYHCIGIGTDGTCTGTDDTGMRSDGTCTCTEGTDSTAVTLMILEQSYHIFTDGF